MKQYAESVYLGIREKPNCVVTENIRDGYFRAGLSVWWNSLWSAGSMHMDSPIGRVVSNELTGEAHRLDYESQNSPMAKRERVKEDYIRMT